ncbi:spermidine sinapoyl-CoA acyltransferase [Herrania umbratica]|uniref:Spermidine sinapoyl-CoA acyltransferase n=1 Tax=Herrania umbratica TaxID=108875 RepID=A0A6J1B952_9ROSI|nr:spermidine sinapoyl-CoA acyltransferase [Herrania umbratica]
MKVQVTETALIRPSTAPFPDDHTLALSHLDNDHSLNVTFRYLRAYVNRTTTDRNPFQVISSAIATALHHYYPLAGSLRRASDGRYELLCQVDQSVPLVNASADCTLESVNYLDDPDMNSVEQLVPDPSPEETLLNPCTLQVTVFKCGGFTLGAAIHNALCDGLGATQFFCMAADLARGVDQIKFQPVWDRAALLGPRNPPRAEGPVREFLGLEKGFIPYKQDVGLVVRECFYVEDECLDQLKSLLFEQCGLGLTTFEILGAYIWRAKVKASKIPGDEIVKYSYLMNIRKIVKPPLPPGYWGNGCVAMYAKVSAKDLIEQPLWKTAELIKKSKSNASDEYVRSFIDLQELHYEEGITAGKGVSGFTDWRHLGHSAVDFGWGGPVTVLPLSTNFLGSMEPCFFLPYSSSSTGRNKGFKVLVSLRETAMPAFKEEMAKFSRKEFEI